MKMLPKMEAAPSDTLQDKLDVFDSTVVSLPAAI